MVRRWGHLVGVIALMIVVAPFVAHAVPAIVGADYSYVVLSGSMAPVITPGDVVFVGETTPEQVEVGDIVTFTPRDSRMPITHRVVRKENSGGETYFTTKGDANENVDPQRIVGDRILGEVLFVVPFIGYVIHYAGTMAGFIAFLVIPTVLLAITEVYDILLE